MCVESYGCLPCECGDHWDQFCRHCQYSAATHFTGSPFPAASFGVPGTLCAVCAHLCFITSERVLLGYALCHFNQLGGRSSVETVCDVSAKDCKLAADQPTNSSASLVLTLIHLPAPRCSPPNPYSFTYQPLDLAPIVVIIAI